MAMPRYALIGDGRLATSMGPYLRQSGAELTQWSRKADAAGGASLSGVLQEADTVLLAISDGAIAAFADTHDAALKGKQLIHFSGALYLNGIAGAHPLYSFPNKAISTESMAEIRFVTEEDGPAFSDLFPSLTNKAVTIDPAQKTLYHALAVLSGNLVSFTWNEVAQVMKADLALEPKDLLIPYFRSLIDGFEASPYDSLTGPIARGDRVTIGENLNALAGQPVLRSLYEALVNAAAQKGLSK